MFLKIYCIITILMGIGFVIDLYEARENKRDNNLYIIALCGLVLFAPLWMPIMLGAMINDKRE